VGFVYKETESDKLSYDFGLVFYEFSLVWCILWTRQQQQQQQRSQ